jgi:hypothetical protein
MAKCLTTAMFFAPCPVLRRDWSSLKMTSSTQWRRPHGEPVEPLDAPMAAHGAGRGLRGEGGGGDVVAGLEAPAILELNPHRMN